MPDSNSFDDILSAPPTPAEKSAVTDLADGGVPAETAEQARIRALEAEIERLTATKAVPVDEVEKSPSQKAAEHAAALQANALVSSSEPTFKNAGDDDIVFHVLVNGLTIAGAVRHPGETVRIKRGSQAYELGQDRTGYNWLTDLSDEGQKRHFGRVVLGVGPFQGTQPDDELARLEASRAGSAVDRVF